MNKFKTFFIAMKIVKNWPAYVTDYFKLKTGQTLYKLRDGSKYLLRAGSNDRNIFNEIMVHKLYNPAGFEIKNGDVVVDIGAHIGIFSIFASKNAIKVYSFEPFPENFHLLCENIRANQKKNIMTMNKAVSLVSGKRNLFVDIENRGGHSFYSNVGRKKSHILVETISLEDFFTQQQITKVDFLKMDCEGEEYEILFNCPSDLLSKIKKISMEYHYIGYVYNFATLELFLKKNGFKVKALKRISMLYAWR